MWTVTESRTPPEYDGLPRLATWAALDHEDANGDVGTWPEGGPGDPAAERALERSSPTPKPGRRWPRPASCGLVLQDEVGGEQPAARLKETAKQRRRHRERRVGDHAIRPSGEAQVSGVGVHHHDFIAEAVAEVSHPVWVRLDGDDAGASGDEGGG